MKKEIINSNIINQLKNPELYESNLFKFLLENCDIQLLQNKTFNENLSQRSLNWASNFSGMIENMSKKNSNENLKSMIFQIKEKFKNEMEEPELYAHVFPKDKKEMFKVTPNMIDFFIIDTDKFFTEVQTKKREKLNNQEEQLFLEYILMSDFPFYIQKKETKDSIYEILLNQKDYLNSKQKNIKTDFLLENPKMKHLISILSIEQLEEIDDKFKNIDFLVDKFMNKLYKKKSFELSNYLSNKNPELIAESILKNSKHPKSFTHTFNTLFDIGILLDANYLIQTYENSTYDVAIRQSSNYNEKKTSKAISELVDMAIILKDNFHIKDVDLVCIYTAIICSKRDYLYVKFREHFPLPQEERFQIFLKNQKLNNRSFADMEKEFLFYKMKTELHNNSNENQRQLKI